MEQEGEQVDEQEVIKCIYANPYILFAMFMPRRNNSHHMGQ